MFYFYQTRCIKRYMRACKYTLYHSVKLQQRFNVIQHEKSLDRARQHQKEESVLALIIFIYIKASEKVRDCVIADVRTFSTTCWQSWRSTRIPWSRWLISAPRNLQRKKRKQKRFYCECFPGILQKCRISLARNDLEVDLLQLCVKLSRRKKKLGLSKHRTSRQIG